jgi:hypothetical protein
MSVCVLEQDEKGQEGDDFTDQQEVETCAPTKSV